MLSIVIPTLNEAANLPATVAHTLRMARGRSPQIIVSDCDSPDGTADVARAMGLTVASGGRSRADALNRGAAAADGDTLLFLHADTLMPDGFDDRIAGALANEHVVGGGFEFKFGPRLPPGRLDRCGLGLVTWVNRFRYRFDRSFFGDQGIFVRRAVFDQLGGFPRLPLMEDVRFSRRMSRLGRTAILNPPSLTSPRRFEAHGVWRQFATDFFFIACEDMGSHPRTRWDHYNGLNRNITAVTG